MINTIQRFLADHCMIYTWHDGAEIVVLAVVVYTFLHWLNKDQSRRPITAFYAYVLLTALAYYAQLSVVSMLLLFASPIFLMLLILMHQHSLQKNFVTYKAIRPAYAGDDLWLDELMRAALNALNKQKEIICVIEQNDDLKMFLSAPCFLNADLRKDVLDLLLEHIPAGSASMVWVNRSGRVIALDAQSKQSADPVWVAPEVKELPLWKHDALFLTSKTDAIVTRICSITRLFDCIMQGKAVEGLTASHALTLLKQQLKKQNSKQEETYFHAYQNRNFTEQHPS